MEFLTKSSKMERYDKILIKQFWLMIIVVPFLALIPDMSLMLLFRVFYKSPADVYMLRQKHGI